VVIILDKPTKKMIFLFILGMLVVASIIILQEYLYGQGYKYISFILPTFLGGISISIIYCFHYKRLILEKTKKESRYKKLFENTNNAVAIYRPIENGNNFELIDINQKGVEIDNHDREKIIGMALQGDGQLIDTGVSPVYEDVLNPDAKLPEYNPEAAQQKLAEAGYEDTDGNGIVNDPENGEDVVLEMIYDGNDVYLKKTAQILAENYKNMGLRLELKPLEKSTYSDLLFNQKKFDVNLGGWGIIDEASDSMYTLYHSTAYLNFMSLDSEKLDTYMENARFSANEEVMLENLYAFQEEFIEEMPVVTLYVQQYNFAYSNDFGGFEVYPSDLKGLVDPQSLSGVYKK